MSRNSPNGSDETTEVENTAEATAADENKAVAPAESATADAETDVKEGSVLDAVTAALEASKERSSGSEQSEDDGKSEGKDEGAAETPAPEEAPEDEKPPPFAQHPAWKRVMRQRDEARRQVEEERRLREQYEQSHKTVQGLQAYMQEAGLTIEEVNNSIAIARLVKNDPAKALEALLPIVRNLQGITGDALPEDLEREVRQGFISRERARELAAMRGRQQFETERQKQAAVMQERQRIENVVAEISRWEREWQSSDPDYKALQPRVLKELKLALYEKGFPRDPASVIRLAEQIRDEVRKEFRPARPKEVRPITTEGAPKKVTAEPKTMIEAVRLAARG